MPLSGPRPAAMSGLRSGEPGHSGLMIGVRNRPHWSAMVVRGLLAVAIAVALFQKYQLIAAVNVNWDEFRFLSRIHELDRGELRTAFQTFHVRLFTWLPALGGSEVDQVIAGRTVAFVLRLAGCLLLYLIGRRLFGTTGALFAVLATLLFSHLIRHGEAFRSDPIIAFLFLVAAALLLLQPSSQGAAMGAGAAIALAALVTVKTAVYLPTIGVIVAVTVCASDDRRATARRLFWAGAVGTGIYIVLFGLHVLTLPGGNPDGVGVVLEQARGAGRRLAFTMPALSALAESIERDCIFWLLVVTGASISVKETIRDAGVVRRSGLAVLGFMLPLGALLLYRNSFAYFYAVIIPSAALSCGLVAARIETWLSGRPALSGVALVALVLALCRAGYQSYVLLGVDTMTSQRTLLDGVREVFPDPVPYIDRCSMVSAYPKVGPFLSTLVLANYRRTGTPIFEGLVRSKSPVFVLANVPGLELALPWEVVARSPHRLLREDFEYLKQHYVHHWGPMWVAGASLVVGTTLDSSFHLPVAGPYTIEVEGRIILDGSLRREGDALWLAGGMHAVRSADRAKRLTLRYGDHLGRPSGPPPAQPLFIGLDYRDLSGSVGNR